MSNNKIYTQAFSLVELLITLVIVTSILLFTLSSLQSIVSKNRAVIYTNELITALQFTRYAAINLGEPIIFCGSKDHKTCQGSWHNGSIVITATSGKILRIFPEIFAGDKLSWQGSFGRQNTITFLPTGTGKSSISLQGNSLH